jgi:hypothetical protein
MFSVVMSIRRALRIAAERSSATVAQRLGSGGCCQRDQTKAATGVRGQIIQPDQTFFWIT